ncbi:OsmC family protein [Spirochaetia bacterium 38H-sp]|uniref:OsmC family protein n=1 Tax=Rarispira pelagica TaxID=3141764 RepID=A0ABU9U9C0_9SPIR
MQIESKAVYRSEMAFTMLVDGHEFTVDADEKFGGKDLGPRPKNLLLSALAGCTGMDVVAILKKMQMPFDSFEIETLAELTEEHPKVFSKIKLIYRFTGKDLDKNKIEKAIKLSQEKYCGVTAMLEKAAEITYDIKLN